jgi:hypothetical protein
MIEDGEGRIWFATNKGLSVFDGKGWMSFTPFNSHIPDRPITAIAVDKEGNRWIGTWGEGLCALKKNGDWQIYTSKNSGIKDNRISALLLDKENNLWIGAPSGLTMFSRGSDSSSISERYALDRLWDFGPPLRVPASLPEQGIFEWDYTWTNREKEMKKITLNFGLCSTLYRKPLWLYAFLWVDEVPAVTPSQGLNYQVKQDSWGNQWIEIQGSFTKVSFLGKGLSQGDSKTKTPHIEKVPRPFPKEFPREVKGYLRSTGFLPANDPGLIDLARSLIKEASQGDMYLMAKDLIFSPLFRDIAFDYGQSQEVYSFLNADGMIRVPQQVIEENKGIGFSKARLLACLARSLTIPSRLVLTGGNKVWCELWIKGLGWLSADLTFPVYDYVWSERLAFPGKIDLSGEAVTSLSGEEGRLKGIEWYPDTEANMNISIGLEGSLTMLDAIPKVNLIILQPTSLKELPVKAKIEVAKDLYAFVLKEGNKEFLLIQDEKGGEKGRWELKESKDVLSVEIEGKMSLKCTIKRMGEYIILEKKEWKVISTLWARRQSKMFYIYSIP